MVPGSMQDGLSSLITLCAWMIWKRRNDCALDGSSPNVQKVLLAIKDEMQHWCMAEAKGLARVELLFLASGALFIAVLVEYVGVCLYSMYICY